MAGEPTLLGCGDIPGVTGGIEQGGAAPRRTAGEEAFAQVEPDLLDRAQLGAAGRQRDGSDVAGHVEPMREVRAGSVEDQCRGHVGRELLGEMVEEQAHAGGGGLGQSLSRTGSPMR